MTPTHGTNPSPGFRSSPDFDRQITALLDARAQPHAPEGLLSDTLAVTSRTRRRPAWRVLEKWIPMPIAVRLAVMPRAVVIMLTLMIVMAFTAAAIAVGSSLAPTKLPPPTGPARNGLIAYDDQGDIWVVDPDGANPRPFVTDETIDIDPVWSPDGTHLAFWAVKDPASQPTTTYDLNSLSQVVQVGTASLVVVGADGSGRRDVGSDLKMDSFALPPSWSPDSQDLVYSRMVGQSSECVTVHIGGASDVTAQSCQYPVWSTDGLTIAYSGGSASNRGVWLAEARGDGSDARRLSHASGSGYAFTTPQWSPASDKILYYAGDDGSHDIWVANADGSGEQRVSSDVGDEAWPAWAPDAQRIAWQDQVGDISNFRLVVADPDGSNLTRVEDAPIMTGAPMTWSPDGTRLIGFAGDSGGTVARTLSTFDATGALPPVAVQVDSPWWSSSWQRLAQ